MYTACRFESKMERDLTDFEKMADKGVRKLNSRGVQDRQPAIGIGAKRSPYTKRGLKRSCGGPRRQSVCVLGLQPILSTVLYI